VVNHSDLPRDTQTFDCCRFDKKTCAKCEKRKVALVKDWDNKTIKKEICLDKECYATKEKASEEVNKKATEEQFKKKVAKIKEKAAKGKIDRAMMIAILLNNLPWNIFEALAMAYDLKRDLLQNHKKATEYFTRNTKVNVEEILRFVTYWKE
jgi:chloramphenicol O-acetyltransferase